MLSKRTWIGTALMLMCSAQLALAEKPVERGRYLVSVIGCGDCHTPGSLAGQPDVSKALSGSEIGFAGPPPAPGVSGGVVYPSNLTSDKETGLGAWSDAEILRALREGKSRDGRPLAPVMPWPNYVHLTESDAQAIVAYLRSLAPIKHAVPAPVPPGQKASHPYLQLVQP